MKKLVFAMLLAALTLSACQKTPADEFRGSYSFKTGGSLELKTEDNLLTKTIVPESGQMHVLADGADKVKLTLNVTGGTPVVFDGTVGDGVLSLSPSTQKVLIYKDDAILDVLQDVLLTVSGKGRRYENTLIIDLDYSGSFNLGNVPCKVNSSSVKCIATLNE